MNLAEWQRRPRYHVGGLWYCSSKPGSTGLTSGRHTLLATEEGKSHHEP